ncbi:MAG: hypothetical protein AMXMBFR23_18670 [Chloroflexota bacterium]
MRARVPRLALRLAAPGFTAGALLLAACSGGGDTTPTAEPGVSTATPVATATASSTPAPARTPAAEDALRAEVEALLDATFTEADLAGAEWEQFDSILVGEELAQAAGGADALTQMYAGCGLIVASEPVTDATFGAARTFGAGADPLSLTLVVLSVTEWSSPEQAERSLDQGVTVEEVATCAAEVAAAAGQAEIAAVDPNASMTVTSVEGIELEGAPDGILAWGIEYTIAVEGLPGVEVPPFTTRQVMLGWTERNAVVQVMVQQMGEGTADVDYARLYDLVRPRFAEAYAALGR